MSVITNVAVMQLETAQNIQQMQHLMPGQWLTSEGKEDVIIELCNESDDQPNQSLRDSDFFLNLKKVHYQELYRTLDIVIQQIQGELMEDPETGEILDSIDIYNCQET